MSTHFDHKNIHKSTWISPDGQTENQIDHVVIDEKHAVSIKDVRSYRGADISSDHFLVIAKIKQEWPRDQPKTNSNKRKKYNYTLLENEETKNKMQEQIKRKFEETEAMDIEGKWQQIQEVLTKVADEWLKKDENIANFLDTARERNIENFNEKAVQNLEILKRLIDAVVYLSKEERSFRGHDETCESDNNGNFKELIDFMKTYDQKLERFLSEATVFVGTSKSIQNDLIESIS
nr:unnamed protein product [Callosobruchus chinensis]